jgi:predicted phosphodiesterase
MRLNRAFRAALSPFLLLLAAWAATTADPAPLRFAILGDRTGEARPGVYEQVWRETAAENPAFVVTVGDTIEGLHDATAQTEWQQVEKILKPYRRLPIYLTPGNHDVWSAASEQWFREHAKHPVHYSFDYGQVHVTVLDNSRTEQFSAEEMAFLETDLKAHAAQPVKFIFSHRPSWLISVALQNPDFALHQLARRYGVQYVIAGHLHQMLHLDFQGVTYISMASAGGHLRISEAYRDGWFFGHALVEVRGTGLHFQIEEVKSPHGQGRVTTVTDWGPAGLIPKHNE